MPRLTSKMTVKIEPELLQKIQDISESRNISVSYYVREALIKYQREADEERNNRSMRIRFTPLESFIMGELKRVGFVTESEQLFHKSFDSFLKNDLERTLDIGNRLKDMKGFSSEEPQTNHTAGSEIDEDPEENDDHEGDAK